jgi:hypothetical protein
VSKKALDLAKTYCQTANRASNYLDALCHVLALLATAEQLAHSMTMSHEQLQELWEAKYRGSVLHARTVGIDWCGTLPEA